MEVRDSNTGRVTSDSSL